MPRAYAGNQQDARGPALAACPPATATLTYVVHSSHPGQRQLPTSHSPRSSCSSWKWPQWPHLLGTSTSSGPHSASDSESLIAHLLSRSSPGNASCQRRGSSRRPLQLPDEFTSSTPASC